MEQTANRHNLIGSYVFTALVVAALVAVYLLTGQRDRQAAEAALTPLPPATPTPFGRPAHALLEDLLLYGVAAAEEGDGYRLTLGGADAACTLTLSLAQGRVAGFTLVFAAVEEPDADGSAIAAALQARAAQEREAQAAAMERVLDAVLRAYDGAGELPQTVRARWCAAYAALQEGETAEDTHGPVAFETYPAGRGTRLCCAVLAK